MCKKRCLFPSSKRGNKTGKCAEIVTIREHQMSNYTNAHATNTNPRVLPSPPNEGTPTQAPIPTGPERCQIPWSTGGALKSKVGSRAPRVSSATHPLLPPPTIPNPLAEARKHLKSTPLVDCTPPRLTWLASILSRPRSYGTAWRYDTAARRGGRAQMARYLSRYSSSALSSARDERTRRSAALR